MNSTSATSGAWPGMPGAAISPTSESAARKSAITSTDTFEKRSPRKPPPMPPIGRIQSFSVVIVPAITTDKPIPSWCR